MIHNYSKIKFLKYSLATVVSEIMIRIQHITINYTKTVSCVYTMSITIHNISKMDSRVHILDFCLTRKNYIKPHVEHT